jgi:hypothetical protein
MLRFASVVFALSLSASLAFASEDLTGPFTGQVNPSPDQGTICFSQVPGDCGDGFVSAIISQSGTAICGTYAAPAGGPPRSRTADEYRCATGSVNGLHWWGTYFGNGWNPATCPALGAAATFNHIFYLGGTTCPDDAFIFCNLQQVTPVATNIGGNNWEYRSKFTCPGGIPIDTPVFVTVQINENAYPQWGWTESALNLQGQPSCLNAPDFNVNTWQPIGPLVGSAWCGQAFEVQVTQATAVETSTWGVIKDSFYSN